VRACDAATGLKVRCCHSRYADLCDRTVTGLGKSAGDGGSVSEPSAKGNALRRFRLFDPNVYGFQCIGQCRSAFRNDERNRLASMADQGIVEKGLRMGDFPTGTRKSGM